MGTALRVLQHQGVSPAVRDATFEEQDVCGGRGKGFCKRKANVEFRNECCSVADRYNAADGPYNKKKIILPIINKWKDAGARFLKRDKQGHWREMTERELNEFVQRILRPLSKTRLGKRTRREDEPSSTEPYGDSVYQNDILGGRGNGSCTHPGNKKLRAICKDELETFQVASTKADRDKVVQKVLKKTRTLKGRFLRPLTGDEEVAPSENVVIDGKWLEMPNQKAREKIREIFRDLVRKSGRVKMGNSTMPRVLPVLARAQRRRVAF